MAQEFTHEPVMVERWWPCSPVPPGVVVDGTVGGGGHAAALLAAHRTWLLGLDRDPDALAAATERLAAVRAVGPSYATPDSAIWGPRWRRPTPPVVAVAEPGSAASRAG